MNGNPANVDRLQSLLPAMLDDRLTDEQAADLEDLLRDDPAALQGYVQQVSMHVMLQWANNACEKNDEGGAVQEELRTETAPSIPPFSLAIPHGFFFGRVPLAYVTVALFLGVGLFAARHWGVGNDVRSRDIGLAGGTAVASGGAGSAGNPAAPAGLPCVAHLSGTDNCRWADPKTVAKDGEAVALGRKLAISSGALGIDYSAGARVTLVGPATYVVDSALGGFLSFGKLTARVEKGAGAAAGAGQSAPGGTGLASGTPDARIRTLEDPNRSSPSHLLARLFVRDAKTGDPSYVTLETVAPMARPRVFFVRTPTTVTRPSLLRMYRAGAPRNDDGTEFSVEVDKSGMTAAHVLRGTVDLHILSPADTYDYEVSLVEAQFVRLELDAARGMKMMVGLSVAEPGMLAGKLSRPVPIYSAQDKSDSKRTDRGWGSGARGGG